MRITIFILCMLLVLSTIILGGCSGTVDSSDSKIPSPPSLPEDIEKVPEDSNNLQPPSLPEE